MQLTRPEMLRLNTDQSKIWAFVQFKSYIEEHCDDR